MSLRHNLGSIFCASRKSGFLLTESMLALVIVVIGIVLFAEVLQAGINQTIAREDAANIALIERQVVEAAANHTSFPTDHLKIDNRSYQIDVSRNQVIIRNEQTHRETSLQW